ncbi:hypothetical protein D3C71_1780900 [compost metagenome]
MLHCLPLKSPAKPPLISAVPPFSLATPWAAKPAELAPPSTTATRPCVSNQRRTSAEATSALFWLSAPITSTVLPATLPPKSSTAIRTAISEPWPPRSE